MESFCASPKVKQGRGVDAASASEQDFNFICRQGIYNILECNAMLCDVEENIYHKPHHVSVLRLEAGKTSRGMLI